MSVRSLYQTFLWEGAYYGLIASGSGAITGWLCTSFVNAAAVGAWQFSPFPLVPVPVSYTHLDVYKRQVMVSKSHCIPLQKPPPGMVLMQPRLPSEGQGIHRNIHRRV